MNLKDSLVPDLANPPKVRRKRAPKHDFKDGLGRVFAHKHDNGGGWVADTAKVAESARVTRNAQVSGFARVDDTCQIEGRALVTGHARLSGNVRVQQNAVVNGAARLFDRVVVSGNSRIFDNAVVSGSSTLANNVQIFGWAQVVNSRICGPTVKNLDAQIGGSARVLDSNIWNVVRVLDNAYLHRASVNNVIVRSGAHLLDSNAATTTASNSYAFFRGQELPAGQSIENYLTTFQCTLIGSAVNVPPCTVESTLFFLNCQISLGVLPFPGGRWENTIYFNLRTTNTRDVAQYSLNSGSQIQVANTVLSGNGIPTVASIGVVPSPETTRQRRIMRLERGNS